jgi:mRNA interferase HicA
MEARPGVEVLGCEKRRILILAGRRLTGGVGLGRGEILPSCNYKIHHKSCIFRLAGYNNRVVCFALRVRLWRAMCMKYSEFGRWLSRQGAEFAPAKGSHFRVTLDDRSTIFPDHGSKEMGTDLVEQIKKQLGSK